ncbi:hypothetical protein QJS66_04230 [Kocuria rhizophila]|nr:hypothetical protein QJS66_04230 [Kocuria rhizophila]
MNLAGPALAAPMNTSAVGILPVGSILFIGAYPAGRNAQVPLLSLVRGHHRGTLATLLWPRRCTVAAGP